MYLWYCRMIRYGSWVFFGNSVTGWLDYFQYLAINSNDYLTQKDIFCQSRFKIVTNTKKNSEILPYIFTFFAKFRQIWSCWLPTKSWHHIRVRRCHLRWKKLYNIGGPRSGLDRSLKFRSVNTFISEEFRPLISSRRQYPSDDHSADASRRFSSSLYLDDFDHSDWLKM